MDFGERSVTLVPGALELDDFLTFAAECMIDHAIKTGIVGNDGNYAELPPIKEG